MKKLLLSAAAFAVVAVSAVAVAPTTAEAVPAYARQTGAACLSCHFQSIPRLNAFGRNFRINGHRDVGEQALLEDDHLSLPANLNASLLVKSQFLFQNQANGGDALDWPNEAAIWVGGRLSEHVGGTVEWGTDGAVTTKVFYVFDLDNGVVAIGGGATDGLGTNFMFNDPSNATSRPTRGWLSRPQFLDDVGVMTQGLSAFGAYGYFNNLIYVAAGGIMLHRGAVSGAAAGATSLPANLDLDFSPYVRGAITTELAGLDVVAGAWWADVQYNARNAAAVGLLATQTGKATTYGADLQVQGELGDISFGFYLPMQFEGEDVRTINAAGAATNNSTGYAPALNVAFGHLGLRAMYDYTKRKNDVAGTSVTRKRTTFGGWYSVAQNVELMLDWQSLRVTNAATANRTVFTVEYVY